jgi:membrane fusion protein (multidrug efflux system)
MNKIIISGWKWEAGRWKQEVGSRKFFYLPSSIFLLPATFFLLLLPSCKNKTEEQQTNLQASEESRNIPTVLISNPKSHKFETSLQISGTAKPNQQVKIFAMTSGMLHTINRDLGDFVKQGEILATLDNPDLIQQKAKAEADLNGKKSIFERLKNVYDKTAQLTTIAEVEKAQAEYESAKATVNALAAQVDYLQIQAPFAGVIVNRFVDKGAIIQNGLNNSSAMPLFELQDLKPIRLTIEVSETDAMLIDKTTKAQITFPESPNSTYRATVSRIAYGLDETSKTMKVEIDLPNANLKIRPGMYAKVEIQRSGHKDALSIQNEAIGNVKGQAFIYLIENGRVKKVEIKTGMRDEKFTELLSGELKITDKIVVQGKEFCSEGAVVQMKEMEVGSRK